LQPTNKHLLTMAFKFVFFAILAVVVSAVQERQYQSNHLAPQYQEEEKGQSNYAFEYSIQNGDTGDIKSAHESRDGDRVQGYYTVVEPDGARRIVHYTADPEHGFMATVEREEAKGYAAPAQTKSYSPQRSYSQAPAQSQIYSQTPSQVLSHGYSQAPAQVQYSAPAEVRYAPAPAEVQYSTAPESHTVAPVQYRTVTASPVRYRTAAPARVSPPSVYYEAPNVEYQTPAPMKYTALQRVRQYSAPRVEYAQVRAPAHSAPQYMAQQYEAAAPSQAYQSHGHSSVTFNSPTASLATLSVTLLSPLNKIKDKKG